MNILFDADIMNGSFVGFAKSLYYLYFHCHRICPDFHAYGFRSNREEEYPEAGITLIGQKTKRELLAFAKEKKIAVAHYPANIITWPFLPGLKTVLTLHDLIPYEEKRYFSHSVEKGWYLLRTRMGLKMADRITTVSEYSRRSIMGFSGGRVSPSVIYWGVTLPEGLPQSSPPEYKYFLYVGGYDKRKGIDRLVSAFLDMKRGGLTECRLVLAGKPHPLDAETEALIRAGVEEGTIVQTGYVDDAALCGLYAHAVCLAYLSNMEGFGLPIIEAMRFGCPVVTTRKTSLPEIGGDAACYVDRDDPREIQQALSRMERDAAFRESRVASGRANLARFDWDVSAQRFLDILQSLTEN